MRIYCSNAIAAYAGYSIREHEVAQSIILGAIMSEMLLTVDQAAARLQLHPVTIRRQIKRGEIRVIRKGRAVRIPESAITENGLAPNADAPASTPQTRAAAILAGLDSHNPQIRNAAIVSLALSDAQTSSLVEREVEKSVAAYDGPEDDFSDWRALDGEPFDFPEESPHSDEAAR